MSVAYVAVQQQCCSWLRSLDTQRAPPTQPLMPALRIASYMPHASCVQLVFSDEFNSPGRKMGVDASDPRWTADNLWYLGTFDEEVYTPEQACASCSAVHVLGVPPHAVHVCMVSPD